MATTTTSASKSTLLLDFERQVRTFLSNCSALNADWENADEKLKEKLCELGKKIPNNSAQYKKINSIESYLQGFQRSKAAFDALISRMLATLGLEERTTVHSLDLEDPTKFVDCSQFLKNPVKISIVCETPTDIGRLLDHLANDDDELKIVVVENCFWEANFEGMRSLEFDISVQVPAVEGSLSPDDDGYLSICKLSLQLKRFRILYDSLKCANVEKYLKYYILGDDKIIPDSWRLSLLEKILELETTTTSDADFHAQVKEVASEFAEISHTESKDDVVHVVEEKVSSLCALMDLIGCHEVKIALYEKAFTILKTKNMLSLSITVDYGFVLYQEGLSERSAKIMNDSLVHLKKVDQNMHHPASLLAYTALADIYKKSERWVEAEEVLAKLAVIRATAFGPHHLTTTETMHDHANVLFRAEDYAKAHSVHSSTLSARRTALGPEHPLTLQSAHSTADSLHQLKDYAAALEHYHHALDGRAKVLGPLHKDTLGTLNNIGNVLHDQEDFPRAVSYYGRALEGKQITLGIHHPSTIGTVFNLIDSHVANADKESAVATLKDVHAKVVVAEGTASDHAIKVGEKLGQLLRESERFDEAAEVYEQVLTGYEEAKGSAHKATAKALLIFADVLVNAGEAHGSRKHLDRAKEVYKGALEKLEATIGPKRSDTLAAAFSLGLLLTTMEEFEEAHKHLERVRAAREKRYSLSNKLTLDAVNALVRLFHKWGKLDEAEELAKKTRDACIDILGLDDVDTIALTNNLAVILHSKGDLSGAKEFLEYAERGMDVLLGPEHSNAVGVKHNVAINLGEHGQHIEAKEKFAEVVRQREEVHGGKHVDTLHSVFHLAMVHLKQGELEAARPLMERALRGYEMLYGKQHKSTQHALTVHLSLLEELEEFDLSDNLAAEFGFTAGGHNECTK